MDSLEVTDRASAAVAVAPRVSKADIEAKISKVDYLGYGLLTLCIITMQNGFMVLGKSAPASPENYNEQLGQQLAYEDAFRQVWPLEGYVLRERLAVSA